MPTKFVQNVAHKTGTSVEHAEKVWHDAKQAVKKGKRKGSWYWGKVVNTFKRMMGLSESMTFSDFTLLMEDELLNEATPLTIPKLAATFPDKMMVGAGGYILKKGEVKPTKVTFEVDRLLKTEPVNMTVTISLKTWMANDRKYLLQAHGAATLKLNWTQRSQFTELTSPPTPEVLKSFMVGVLAFAGMLKESQPAE